jgi:hypothetical protein
MHSRQFLNELFEHKPDDALISIWHTPLNETLRFKDIDEAVDCIERLKQTKAEIYFGCGLQGKDLGSHKRGSKSDITGIPGFYVDVDIADAVHQKRNLPTTIEDAVSLVEISCYEPTLIINSGHGIHAWWAFKEPWMFDTKCERRKAEIMLQRLQATIKKHAEQNGWTIDSTWDLSRVLRPPGTTNHKDKDNLVEVKVYKNSGPKYADPMDFDQWLIGENELQKSVIATDKERAQAKAGLVLDPMAEPPTDKLDMLMEIDFKFKASWQGKRDDMTDQSPSGYAMSMASIAAAAGWDDQEIADLIIAWNRRHGKDMKKALRPDYIALTIVKARKPIQEDAANKDIAEANALHGTPYENEETKKKALAAASEKLGINIIRIDRFVADNPSFVMVTDKGEVELPSIDYLIRPRNLQGKIAAQLGVYIKYSKKQWPEIAQILLDACGDVKLGPEAEVKKRMKFWLDEYLINRHENSLDDSINRSWESRTDPFVKDGHWYIHSESFRNWAWSHHGFIEGLKRLQIELRRCGCESVPFNVVIESKKTTRNFWRIPKSMVAPAGSV